MRPLLFFDLDDTLLDHRGAEEKAQREIFASHSKLFDGIAFVEWFPRYRAANQGLWEAYGRGEVGRQELTRRRFTEPLSALGLDASEGRLLSQSYRLAYERHWTLNEGAREILEDAAGLGVVGILSNGFRDTQLAKVERLGLERWVSHLILSEDVGAMKPSREIFDAAWRAAGGEPVRKVYVGDSFAHDIVGAKNAGWLPVLYNPDQKPVPAPVLYVTRLYDLVPLLS